MVTIYVIEIMMHDDVITSHIFLTEYKAYNVMYDLIGKHTVDCITLIKKEINDTTGITEDTVLYKTDLRKLIDEEVN